MHAVSSRCPFLGPVSAQYTPCSPSQLQHPSKVSLTEGTGLIQHSHLVSRPSWLQARTKQASAVACFAGESFSCLEKQLEMPEIKVHFKNPDTHHGLTGILLEAQGNKSNNVVILCHGLASSKESPLISFLAKGLSEQGLTTLRFDFAGNGESEGAFEFGNYLQEVVDLRAAVQYVRDDLHMKPVAIVGHSKGGDDVLLYASQYDDVPLVVNVAGRFNMQRGIRERFGEEVMDKVAKQGQLQMTIRTDRGQVVKWYLTQKSIDDRMALNMEAAVRKISLSEVLTVHGTKDTTILVEDAESFSKCIRNHVICLVEGANHNFSQPAHAQAALTKISTWIQQGL
mmetsp:Transcript_9388/g.16616  ORF Transcript_9388/g.16616 Transcript_9388/m.16616 type:complete len:341 (+) Transcript_9388:50-1072(+)